MCSVPAIVELVTEGRAKLLEIDAVFAECLREEHAKLREPLLGHVG